MTRTELKTTAVEVKTTAVELKVEKKERKARKYHPGTKALMQIREMQRTIKPGIPKAPFERVVREIALTSTLSGIKVRFEPDAIRVLQTAAEAFYVGLCRRAVRVSALNKKVTFTPEALQLVNAQYKPDLEGEA